MKLEEIKKYIFYKVTLVSTGAFVLVAVLIFLNHILGLASLVFQEPPVPIQWTDVTIDVFIVLIVGSVTIYGLSRLDLERRRAEILFRDLFINSPVGLFIVQNGRFQVVNPEFERLSGYNEEELLGTETLRLINAEDREMVRKSAIAMLKGKRSTSYEYRFLTKSGRHGLIMERVISIRYRGDRAALGTFMDITERSQAEKRIEQAAKEWKTTFDSITDLISIHDRNYRLSRVNMAFADALKMKPEKLIGKTCYELVHGTDEPIPGCPHRRTLESGKPCTTEIYERRLGAYLELTTSPILNERGEVVSTVHIARDISERKKMEEQLIIADRLASVGELASGIAHELNNPLTSVIGFSQLLLHSDIPDDIRKDLDVVHSEAQRTAEVVKNLLTFARKHTSVKQLVNVNAVIEKVLELRAYEQRVSNIHVDLQLDPDLPELMADYFQLQQVFLNIVINAEHFMIEAHNRGTLTVVTRKEGGTIKITFSDDGPGIAADDLGHVFDPFFTTKEVGKGTGLGLSICHGIVAEQNGRIYAESESGKGATFVVELPVGNL